MKYLCPDKAEAIPFGTDKRLVSFPTFTAENVAAAMIPLADHIKLLGVVLDNILSMNHHVANICEVCFLHSLAIRHIRPAINSDTDNTIPSSLVSFRLDYANSVLHGTSSLNIKRLQRVQN